jgi:hypothetical protein
MNNILLAAVVLLGISPLNAAEFGAGLEGIKESLSIFKNKLAPAKVDPKPIETLFDRLAKDGPSYERAQPLKEGGQRGVKVTLIELEGPQQEGMYRDLLYRRYFSHIEGVEQTYRKGADGKGSIEEYRYKVSLDGKLLEAKRITMTIVGATPQGLVPDPKSIQQVSLPPSDKGVQKRWKKLSAEFLGMGRTIEV